MKKNLFFLTGVVLFMSVAIFSCNDDIKKANAENTDATNHESLIKRGEYLVNVIGCNDCHSPKIMGQNGPELDMSKKLSGYPSSRPLLSMDTNIIKKGLLLFAMDATATGGPWGVSFAANITSDSTTGIGSWTEEQFARALTQGKFNGDLKGRMILPPMPWQGFSSLHDEDVKAIFVYLKSTKPVSNKVPEPIAFNQIK